ncbi:MAG: serine kinase, partial [Cytophagales bacterium]|nr:serine kinase [Armatimonadota bacterium]
YTVGGSLVRLCFAGPALLGRVTPALEHLATIPGSDPALTVCLWDSQSTGVPLPAPDRLPVEPGGAGDRSGAVAVHYGVSGALSLYDAGQHLAVFWVENAEWLPTYECGAPLLTIFHWWLRTQGCQVVHSAAVGTDEGGVLLVGKGGSGKSTTAAACLGSTLRYAGDDYCAVRLAPSPRVHSLYSSGKVCAPDVPRYPHLESALSNRARLGEEKALYYLAPHLPDALSQGFPLHAILLPRVTGSPETRAIRISPAAGLLALAPSTLFQLPGAGSDDFERLSALVRQVPSYALELGTDRAAIPGVILRVLSEHW